MFGLPYKLIGLLAGVAVLAFWAMLTVGLIEDRGKLKTQLDSAIELANANAEAAQAQRAEFDRILTESTKAAADKAAARERANQKRKAITDAPQTDDGPLAPVLRRTLDGLPEPKGGDQSGTIATTANPR